MRENKILCVGLLLLIILVLSKILRLTELFGSPMIKAGQAAIWNVKNRNHVRFDIPN